MIEPRAAMPPSIVTIVPVMYAGARRREEHHQVGDFLGGSPGGRPDSC